MNKHISRYRLNLNFEPVRELLCRYKAENGIPASIGLTDRQRGDFEVWAIGEGTRSGIDVFGNAQYRESTIRSNNRICAYRDDKL